MYYAGGGDEDVKGGGHQYFPALKGVGGSESSRYTDGGGGSKRFKVLVQQGPGVFTPTIVT
jgi:hypothetical protein